MPDHPHEASEAHQGGCACGAFRFTAYGRPSRTGLCHCLTCRKQHGAPFGHFLVYEAGQVALGDAPVTTFESSAHGRRFSCAACGSPVYARYGDDHVELHAGSFDETSLFAPQYELWAKRREDWLPSIADVPHVYDEAMPGTAPSENAENGPQSP